MKDVLVGFRDEKLLKRIAKTVKEAGLEDIRFIVKTSKASVLSEIDEGVFSCALLREDCGYERWKKEEIMMLKDSHDLKIVLLISDELRGDEDMADFLSVGLTSAVFMKSGGIYIVDEIIRMIYADRTTKQARQYYGIEKVANLNQTDSLKKIEFEDGRRTLLGMPDEILGPKLLEVVSDYNMEQTCKFLFDYIDEDLLSRLKGTLEFYDVLSILKKGTKDQPGVIKRYAIPKEIKKRLKERDLERKKSRAHEGEVSDDGEVELCQRSEDIIDSTAIEVEDTLDIETQDEYAFEEEKNLNSITFEDSDGEFSFSSKGAEPVIKSEPLEKAEDTKESLKEKRKKASTPKKQKEEDPKEKKAERKAIGIVAMASVLGMAFLCMIVILFIKITVERKNASMQKETDGYNTRYSPEDVARYELTENGSPMLYDEEGNLLYDGTDPENRLPQSQDEEMDFTVLEELDEPGPPLQEFNDVSGFSDGAEYKGLDLVNMLNGNGGANCTLEMKNGARIEIERGSASIEEFKPSGRYLCRAKDQSLTFMEQ